MKILFISSFYLFKETRFGGSKRLYYFAKELQKYGDVYVICQDGCKELANGAPSQNADFDRFLFLPLEETRSFFMKFFRSGIINEDFLRENSGLVKDFLGTAKFDAAILAFNLALSFIGTVVPPATHPVVYLEDDLSFEKIRTQRAGNIFDIYRSVRLKQLISYYKKKLSQIDTFITISPQEQEIVKRLFPGTHSQVIKYGIPLEEYPFFSSPPSVFTAGFLGNYQHTPNAESLKWFLGSVLPVLKQAIPDLNVLIGGRNIPTSMRNAFPGDSSLVWAENVSPLSDFYKRISVFINPIVSGRGLRTKLIEAAAFGRPIISTGLGAEGLGDLSIDIANSAGEFAECCARLKSNHSYYMNAVQKNRKIVEQRYSLTAIGRQLVDILQPSGRM
jgi:glycosyltransferase involved in cell wall biosynthesis